MHHSVQSGVDQDIIVDVFTAADPTIMIVACTIISFFWAGYNFKVIEATSLTELMPDQSSDRTGLRTGKAATESQMAVLREVYQHVRSGANAFLKAEYTICAQFVVSFAIVILCLIGWYVSLSSLFALGRGGVVLRSCPLLS
jgi:hypothetical protein